MFLCSLKLSIQEVSIQEKTQLATGKKEETLGFQLDIPKSGLENTSKASSPWHEAGVAQGESLLLPAPDFSHHCSLPHGSLVETQLLSH